MLDLTNNEICGIKATGTDPFNAYVLKMVCALAQVQIIMMVVRLISWRPTKQPVSVTHCRGGAHCAGFDCSHALSHPRSVRAAVSSGSSSRATT